MSEEKYLRKAFYQSGLAENKGSLIPLKTKIISYNGIQYNEFVVRKLISEEPKNIKPSFPKKNPFSPWDENLEISFINNKHVLILNKYPVQIGHMLLITKKWEPQTGWLTKSDFNALTLVDTDTKGLWFYNSGKEAGASQEHRHLQLLPRDRNQQYCPRDSWFEDRLDNEYNDVYKKSIFIKRRDTDLYNIYKELCKESLIGNPDLDSIPFSSYNLLISNRWVSVIRRMNDIIYGFNLNALAFAGYLLVTEQSNINKLEEIGPENIISKVLSTV